MIEHISTFVKYPEMEVIKVTKSDCDHIYNHKTTEFKEFPPKEFIVEFRVAKTYSKDGFLLCETHLLHNVFNLNALEEIKKIDL